MEQDWIWGLIGGGLIGLGGAVYLLGNGRIMGASGIIGGLIDGSGRNTALERLAFLAAMIIVPAMLIPLYDVEISTNLTSNWIVVAVAGLLVGVGTPYRQRMHIRTRDCAVSRDCPCAESWQL